MPENIKNKLTEAIDTGEIVNIIYYGGSQPGAVRMIYPVRVDDTGVWAQCIASHRIKRFMLDKIALAEGYAVDYTDEPDRPQEPDNLAAGMEPFIDELHSQGWHIMMNSGETTIELFSFFKNGSPRKTPAVALSHEPDITPTKPWKTGGLSFKYFDRAIDKFMALARGSSPIKNQAREPVKLNPPKPSKYRNPPSQPQRMEYDQQDLFPAFMSLLDQFEALEAKYIQTCLYPGGVELYPCFQNGKPQAVPSFALVFEQDHRPPWAIYGLSQPRYYASLEKALAELLRLGNL